MAPPNLEPPDYIRPPESWSERVVRPRVDSLLEMETRGSRHMSDQEWQDATDVERQEYEDYFNQLGGMGSAVDPTDPNIQARYADIGVNINPQPDPNVLGMSKYMNRLLPEGFTLEQQAVGGYSRPVAAQEGSPEASTQLGDLPPGFTLEAPGGPPTKRWLVAPVKEPQDASGNIRPMEWAVPELVTNAWDNIKRFMQTGDEHSAVNILGTLYGMGIGRAALKSGGKIGGSPSELGSMGGKLSDTIPKEVTTENVVKWLEDAGVKVLSVEQRGKDKTTYIRFEDPLNPHTRESGLSVPTVRIPSDEHKVTSIGQGAIGGGLLDTGTQVPKVGQSPSAAQASSNVSGGAYAEWENLVDALKWRLSRSPDGNFLISPGKEPKPKAARAEKTDDVISRDPNQTEMDFNKPFREGPPPADIRARAEAAASERTEPIMPRWQQIGKGKEVPQSIVDFMKLEKSIGTTNEEIANRTAAKFKIRFSDSNIRKITKEEVPAVTVPTRSEIARQIENLKDKLSESASPSRRKVIQDQINDLQRHLDPRSLGAAGTPPRDRFVVHEGGVAKLEKEIADLRQEVKETGNTGPVKSTSEELQAIINQMKAGSFEKGSNLSEFERELVRAQLAEKIDLHNALTIESRPMPAKTKFSLTKMIQSGSHEEITDMLDMLNATILSTKNQKKKKELVDWSERLDKRLMAIEAKEARDFPVLVSIDQQVEKLQSLLFEKPKEGPKVVPFKNKSSQDPSQSIEKLRDVFAENQTPFHPLMDDLKVPVNESQWKVLNRLSGAITSARDSKLKRSYEQQLKDFINKLNEDG